MPRKPPERSAADFFPPKITLPSLRTAAADCKGCDLWKRGTQTVFGEGTRRSVVMFVGEQPGNEEDLTGKPFVGPAGRLFDKALEEAGIDRKQTYVTNIVKHFNWEPRGKRRIHKKPNALEIAACRPWLEAEAAVVKPEVIGPGRDGCAGVARSEVSRDQTTRRALRIHACSIRHGHCASLLYPARSGR